MTRTTSSCRIRLKGNFFFWFLGPCGKGNRGTRRKIIGVVVVVVAGLFSFQLAVLSPFLSQQEGQESS